MILYHCDCFLIYKNIVEAVMQIECEFFLQALDDSIEDNVLIFSNLKS